MNRRDTQMEASRTDGTRTDGHIDYQTRFDQLQTRFIDEPKEAVREASTLVREAVDKLFDGEEDTEQLRRVMQGYRDLLARLDGREPAAMGVHSSPVRGEMPSRTGDAEYTGDRTGDMAGDRTAETRETTETT